MDNSIQKNTIQHTNVCPHCNGTLPKISYRPENAAGMIDIPEQTLWYYAKLGKIETIKYSDRVTVIEHSELVRFHEARKKETREARAKKAQKNKNVA